MGVLLASVAAAEPWVLWGQFVIGGTEWTPMGSYRELETCNAHTLEIVRTFQSTPDLRVTKREGNMVHLRAKDGTEGYARSVCLPANIDPRK